MLRWRLLLGAALIATLIGLCWLDLQAAVAGSWLIPLALVLAAPAAGEILWLLAGRELRASAPLLYAGNLLLVASNGVPQFWPDYPAHCPLGRWGWPLVMFTLCLLAAFLVELRRYQRPGDSIVRLALTMFGLAYVGLLLSFVVQLRLLGSEPAAGGSPGNSSIGILALASLVAVVKMCDTGAYTVGRLIGRHKMTPVVSPGKTYEGAVGGIAFAVLGSWAVFGWIDPWLRGGAAPRGAWWGWLAYGVIVGLAGMFGDLAESLLKRDMGRKDSSRWLPGFGGVLDVLDSILFAAPVAYLCWIAGLLGPISG